MLKEILILFVLLKTINHDHDLFLFVYVLMLLNVHRLMILKINIQPLEKNDYLPSLSYLANCLTCSPQKNEDNLT